MNFNRRYPDIVIHPLFKNKRKAVQGWVVREFATEEDIARAKAGYKGAHNAKSDRKIYDFVHVETGHYFSGTKWDLLEIDNKIRVHSLISGSSKVSRGWALLSVYTSTDTQELLNPYSGERGSLADLNSYTFKNLVTGEVFIGTRSAFKNKFRVEPQTLFLNTHRKLSVRDWCLIENFHLASRTSRRDYNVYKVIHESGEIYEGTRDNFTKTYGYSISKLFLKKHKQKTCKGWKLVDNSLAIS